MDELELIENGLWPFETQIKNPTLKLITSSQIYSEVV